MSKKKKPIEGRPTSELEVDENLLRRNLWKGIMLLHGMNILWVSLN